MTDNLTTKPTLDTLMDMMRELRDGMATLEERLTKTLEERLTKTLDERLTKTLDEDKLLVVNVSGRGDKDIFTVAEALGVEL